MITTWIDSAPVTANTRTTPTLGLRFVSLTVAGLICAGATYFAMTQHFGVTTDTIDNAGAVETVVEETNPPPQPPPLVVRDVDRTPLIEPMISPFTETEPPTPFESAVESIPQLTPRSVLTNATFSERPDARDFSRYFPPRALARGQTGRVVLDCVVGSSGRLSCAVESEQPAGWGFGEASLRAAEHFRVAPATTDGRPTSDGRLRVPMTWRAE